jgi:hypothetical protein
MTIDLLARYLVMLCMIGVITLSLRMVLTKDPRAWWKDTNPRRRIILALALGTQVIVSCLIIAQIVNPA